MIRYQALSVILISYQEYQCLIRTEKFYTTACLAGDVRCEITGQFLSVVI